MSPGSTSVTSPYRNEDGPMFDPDPNNATRKKLGVGRRPKPMKFLSTP
jgi:hypothetical protein